MNFKVDNTENFSGNYINNKELENNKIYTNNEMNYTGSKIKDIEMKDTMYTGINFTETNSSTLNEKIVKEIKNDENDLASALLSLVELDERILLYNEIYLEDEDFMRKAIDRNVMVYLNNEIYERLPLSIKYDIKIKKYVDEIKHTNEKYIKIKLDKENKKHDVRDCDFKETKTSKNINKSTQKVKKVVQKRKREEGDVPNKKIKTKKNNN